MAENYSREGQKVEQMAISDEPHDKYRGFNPWTGEELTVGIPILTSTPGGNVVDKEITYSTVICPECDIPAKYTSDSEPVCPQCGIICAGKDGILREQIVIDAKAAGRM